MPIPIRDVLYERLFCFIYFYTDEQFVMPIGNF